MSRGESEELFNKQQNAFTEFQKHFFWASCEAGRSEEGRYGGEWGVRIT
jgi:hypothetical protein